MKIIKVEDEVTIKMGSYLGRSGIVTMIATINGKKRYYVKRKNGTIVWYNRSQISKTI